MKLIRVKDSYEMRNGTLFQIMADARNKILLRCLSTKEALQVMNEVHAGLACNSPIINLIENVIK